MAEKFIEIDGEALFKVVEALKNTPKEIRPAIAHAINKTMDSTVTQVKREVAAEYTIKQKDIAQAITKKRATVSNLTGAAIAEGGQVALYKFKHTPVQPPPKQIYIQPVKAQVKKSGGKKLVARNGNKAFIQTINGKHMIWVRKSKRRFPIEKLYAMSVPQMITDKNDSKGSIQRIKARTQEMLEKKVEQEINYRLLKLGKEATKGKGK